MPEPKYNPLSFLDNLLGTSFDEDKKINEVDNKIKLNNLTFDDLLEPKTFKSDKITTNVVPETITEQGPSEEEIRTSSKEFKIDQQNFSNYLDTAVFDPNKFSNISETNNMSVIYRNKNNELDDLVDDIYDDTKNNPFLQLEYSGFRNLNEQDQRNLIKNKVAIKAIEYRDNQINSINVQNILSLGSDDSDNAILYKFNKETNDWERKSPKGKTVVNAYQDAYDEIIEQDEQKNEYTRLTAKKNNGEISNEEYVIKAREIINNKYEIDQLNYQDLVSKGIPAVPPEKNKITFYDKRNVNGEIQNIDITQKVGEEEQTLNNVAPPALKTLYQDNVSNRLLVKVKDKVKNDYKLVINNKAKINVIGDYLIEKGYKVERQEDGTFIARQISYSDISQWSDYIGTSGFFKDVTMGSKRDQVIPIDRKINQEDFIDELSNYNEFKDNVEIKRQALSHIYLENRSIVDIDNGFFNVIANNTPGLKEVLNIQDDRAVIDASVELMNKTGKQLTAEEEEKAYVGIDETLYESIPGLVGVVASMYVAGQVQNFAMGGRLLKGIYDTATKTRYFTSSGKLIKNIGEKATKAGFSSVDGFAVASKFIPKSPTTLSKAKLQFVNLLFEDAKFALLLDGGIGEGASFAIASQGISKLLPGSKDYRLRLVGKIISSSGGFVAGSEASALIGELVEDISGDTNFNKFIEEQYPEYLGGSSTERDFNKRLIVSAITGAALHLSHMKRNDITSDSELQRFLAETRVKKAEASIKVSEYIEKNKLDETVTDPSQLGILSGKNPNLMSEGGKEISKLIDDYAKHAELEAITVSEITARANIKLYTDPVTRVKAYNDLLKPQVDYLKENYDFDLKIQVKEDASKDSKKGSFDPKTKTLTINPLKANVGVVPHELSHVMKHVMFKGDIVAEGKFKNQLETILKEIKLSDGSSVYEGIQRLIEPDKDGKVGLRKELEIEEMFSYGVEFMSQPGMYDYIRRTDAFTKIKKVLSEDISGSSIKTTGDVLEWMYEFSNTINSKYNPKKSFEKFSDIVDVLGATNTINSKNEKRFSDEIDNISASNEIQNKYERLVAEGKSKEEITKEFQQPNEKSDFGDFAAITQSLITSYANRNGMGSFGSISDPNSKAYSVAIEMMYGPRGIRSIIEKYDPTKQPLTKTVLKTLEIRAPEYFDKALELTKVTGEDISTRVTESKVDLDTYEFKEIDTYADTEGKKTEGKKVEKELNISSESILELKTEIKNLIETIKIEDISHKEVAKATLEITRRAVKEALDLSFKSKVTELQRQRKIIIDNAAKLYELIPKSINEKTLQVTNAAKAFPSLFVEVGRAKFSTAPSAMTRKQKAAGVMNREKVLDSTGKILVDAIFKPGDTNQQSVKRIISLVDVIGGTLSNQTLRETLSESTYQDFLLSTNKAKFQNLKVENILENLKGSLPDILFSEKLENPERLEKINKIEEIVDDLGLKIKEYNVDNPEDIEKLKLDVTNAYSELKSISDFEKSQLNTIEKALNDIVFDKDYTVKKALDAIEEINKNRLEVLQKNAINYVKDANGEQLKSWPALAELIKEDHKIDIVKSVDKKDLDAVKKYEKFIVDEIMPNLPLELITNKQVLNSLFPYSSSTRITELLKDLDKKKNKKDIKLNSLKPVVFDLTKSKLVTLVDKMSKDIESDKKSNTKALIELSNNIKKYVTKKGSTYEETVESNNYALELILDSMYDYMQKNSFNEGSINNAISFLAEQHSSQNGAVRALANLETVSIRKFDIENYPTEYTNWLKSKLEKKPEEERKSESDIYKFKSYIKEGYNEKTPFENLTAKHKRNFKISRLYAEHVLQTFNLTTNFISIAIKNKNNKEAYKQEFKEFSKNYKTGIITSSIQKMIDGEAGVEKLTTRTTSTDQDAIANITLVKDKGNLADIVFNRKNAQNTLHISSGKTLDLYFKEKIGIKTIIEEVNAVSKALVEKVELLGEKPSISDAENIEIIRKAEQQSKQKALEDIQLNSEELSKELNIAIENKFGIPKEKVYSKIEASKLGKDANKLKIMAWSAQDFRGLLQPLKGKGVIGDAAENWIQKNLVRPFAIANRNIDADRVAMTNDFAALKKELKGLIPDLTSKAKVEGLSKNIFSNQDAVRVYIWNKQGNSITGLNEGQIRKLSEYVSSNPQLKYFADKLIELGKGEGYVEPGENWETGTITTDLLKSLNENGRAKHLEEWQANVDIIFSEDNLNKIEAVLGSNHREALENSLERMKTGRNKINMFSGKGARLENLALDWLNNSVGAIMFMNSRSAVLQTLSSINYINWSDNNILAAGKAIANQKQYWKDFTTIFNSDFLVERRGGLKINVSESEIADAAATSKNKIKGALNYVLRKGFLPTKYADSFAIATGGATFYRNRLNRYLKQGLNEQSAKNRAFEDFREITEVSQQSSRPDLISQQQASTLGRLVLAFGNTPAQYVRIMDKSLSDLRNGRGDWRVHVSKIIYYSAVQNLMFSAAQNALFVGLFDETDEITDQKKYLGTASAMADGLLRGMGIYGAAISTMKNIMLEIHKQNEKKKTQFKDVGLRMLDMSPPVDSKIGKLRSAGLTFDYNMAEIKERGFSLKNPAYLAGSQVLSGGFNIPLDRVFRKYNNIEKAFDTDTENWKRPFLFMGWQDWELYATEKERLGDKFKPLSKKEKAYRSRLKKKLNLNDQEVEEYLINKRKNK